MKEFEFMPVYRHLYCFAELRLSYAGSTYLFKIIIHNFCRLNNPVSIIHQNPFFCNICFLVSLYSAHDSQSSSLTFRFPLSLLQNAAANCWKLMDKEIDKAPFLSVRRPQSRAPCWWSPRPELSWRTPTNIWDQSAVSHRRRLG